MRLAMDMSSLMWRSLLAGKDGEFGRDVWFEDRKVHVNSAEHGYENFTNHAVTTLRALNAAPINVLMVFEGMQSKKRRLFIDPAYKQGRDSRPPEAYTEFHRLKERLQAQWLGLGATMLCQDGVEGDDVIAYLAENSEQDLVIDSYDGDLAALIGTNKYGARISTWNDQRHDFNPYGPFDPKLIPAYKSLVGDTSDNIKGCPGFGEKSWIEFYTKYEEDGIEEFLGLLEKGSLDELHEQAADCRLLKLICKEEKTTLKSYQLVKLHPDWVDTMQQPLQITPGYVKQWTPDTDERLKDWYGRSYLITAENFEQFSAWMQAHIAVSPFVALDIETSTPEESDEWLERQDDPDGVDTLGATLTGLGLTFGENNQISAYFSVNHAITNNIESGRVAKLIQELVKPYVIHNLNYELPVLKQEWGEYLKPVYDTKLEASYLNEDEKKGLKHRSKLHFGYEQRTYLETTRLKAPKDKLLSGGRLIREWVETGINDTQVQWEERQYKMCELPARMVVSYGCDDTIMTAALHNYCRLVMELEHTWEVYKEIEIDAAYLTAQSFLDGKDFSLERMNELAKEDKETFEGAWGVLRAYLQTVGWEGTVCPIFTPNIDAAGIKKAYNIITEEELKTQVRTPEKLVKLIEAENKTTLARAVLDCINGNPNELNTWVKDKFKGEPDFNLGSPKQMAKLLYEVMGLPVRLSNKPTDLARKAGELQGSPKTDVYALDFAIKYDTDKNVKHLLEAIKLMRMVQTRFNLYYEKYPGFIHWKTGKLHSSINQCEANTRRSSSSKPNDQQFPKHPKIEGQAVKFRETIIPHKRNAVVVSMDFKSQELVMIADYSRDPNMVACFVGENKKDMHALTGVGIFNKTNKQNWTYEQYEQVRHSETHELLPKVKEARVLGKKVNFTTEYGAMAEKVAMTLIITEPEAQDFIDAKEAAFPVAAKWKESVIKEVKQIGYVTTKLGARRHLRAALTSENAWDKSKAERQAVNFKIQGSCAEQTKQAMCAAWRRKILKRFDCRFYGPIHDELVWSCAIDDLFEFIPAAHACMVLPYGDMVMPIESSISFGWNFGQQIEIGEQPTREAIQKGLDELYGKQFRQAA